MKQSSRKEERRGLIEVLYDQGITDEHVLRAMAAVPREEFVSEGFQTRAYENEALPIECGQTISQPFTVAMMTVAADVSPGDRVLEIGTGSGYQAAVLAEMGARVWSIERHLPLLEVARRRLEARGYKVATRQGDGTLGWREYAPYRAILVTAGAPEIPVHLVDQLEPGGRLIVPVGPASQQMLTVVTRMEDGRILTDEIGPVRFVPLIGKRGWSERAGE